MSKEFSVSFNEDSSMAYVTFQEGKVARTVCLDEDFNLDLDVNDNVLGLEYLTMDVPLPEEKLIKEFKLDAELVHKLNHGLTA
jgi:uncharacterized protein YuzE